MDSWLKTTDLCGPALCAQPEGTECTALPTGSAVPSETPSFRSSRVKCN